MVDFSGYLLSGMNIYKNDKRLVVFLFCGYWEILQIFVFLIVS